MKTTRQESKRIDGRAAAHESAPPDWITPELIRATIETWQPFYRDSLTPDDAVIILTNVGRLFGVLSRD